MNYKEKNTLRQTIFIAFCALSEAKGMDIKMIRNYLDKKGFEFKQGSVKKTFGIQVSMISEGIDSGLFIS